MPDELQLLQVNWLNGGEVISHHGQRTYRRGAHVGLFALVAAIASQSAAGADRSPDKDGLSLVGVDAEARCRVASSGEYRVSNRQDNVEHVERMELPGLAACATDRFDLPVPDAFAVPVPAVRAEATAMPFSADPVSAGWVAAQAETVDIPDPGLRAAVAARLGKQSGEAITAADMDTLTTLSAVNRGITDLTGLRHAAKLQRLYLDSNEILDVWELAGLSALTHLSLRENLVADVSPLANLRLLRLLRLGHNLVTDISAFQALTRLEILDLAHNGIDDVWPLHLLTRLRELRLDGNDISDLWSLAELRALRVLTLDDNWVENASPLSGSTTLRALSLAGNRITNLYWLSNLKSLERLWLGRNGIADLSGIEQLTNLSLLGLGANEIEDVSTLSGLEGLVHLDLSGNRIVDISPLAGLTSLAALGLANNSIRDGGPLEGLSGLTALDVQGNALPAVPELSAGALRALWLGRNEIRDLGPLAGLMGLKSLWLGGNEISDLSALSDLSDLETLSLWGNALVYVGPLSNLRSLRTLWLPGNKLSDLSPLSGLTELTFLSLSDNEIANTEPLADLEEIRTLLLDRNEVSDIAPLGSLAGLRLLSLSGNAVSDLRPMAALTALHYLYLGDNEVDDLSPLSGLSDLTRLWLHGNSVADIGPLSGLTNLILLSLNDNDVSDISALSAPRNLWRLYLAGNEISDASPLAENRGIGSGDYVDLRRNPLGAASVENHVETLRERGAVVSVDAPDLVVGSLSVSDASPAPGASFTLTAGVRNRGDGPATATTLRYYRSSDSSISTRDNEIGTDSLGDLAASANSSATVDLTAPSAVGTYYYGACVDSVGGESDTTNNCSEAVTVEVGGNGGGGGTGDDQGDDIGSATSVSVPSSTDGEIETGSDRDYFRLSVSAATTLTVGTTGSTDTYGRLLDGGGHLLTADDDNGDGRNFEIERDVDAGTYYVEVRGFSSATGTYQLQVSAASDDHGDDIGSATSVSVPSSTDGEIETGSDRDYFRFSVSAATTLTVGTTGSTDTYGRLLDGDGHLLTADNDNGDGRNFEIERDVDAGTYYVEVREFRSVTTGTYQLHVSAASGGGQDAYCRDGDTIRRGERCDVYSTDAYFEVDSSGRGCPRDVPGVNIGCVSSDIRIDFGGVRIHADRSGGGYRIDDVDPEPED